MNTPDRDPLEDRLRDALHDPVGHVDADSLLDNVHRGVRRRRTRRAAASGVAVLAVLGGGGYAVAATGLVGSNDAPVANHTRQLNSAPITTSSDTHTSASPSSPPTTSRGTQATPDAASQAQSTPKISVPSQVTLTGRGSLPAGPLQALSLTATGSMHQWVLAKPKGCDDCAHLLYTDDGGSSWTDLGRLPKAAATGGGVHQVRFVKPSPDSGYHGWMSGPDLWATHDNAKTWHRLLPGRRVSQLAAWGNSVYAVASSTKPGASEVLLQFPVTSDHWRRVDVGQPLSQVTDLAVSSNALAFINRSVDGSSSQVFVGSDHGRNWTTPRACPSGTQPRSLSTAEDSVWVVCNAPNKTVLAVSVDHGRSWTPGATFSSNVTVAARTNTEAIVLGSGADGIVEVSASGEITPLADPPVKTVVNFAAFTNPDVGYLMEVSGKVWRTEDGGHTWSPYTISVK